MPVSTPQSPASPSARHEPNTASMRTIWITVGTFFAILALISAGVWYLLGRYQAAHPDVLQPIAVPTTAAPVAHWANPPADLAKWRQEQRERLDGYGWMDRDAGIARIPIERAMELMVQLGWPSDTKAATQTGESPTAPEEVAEP